MFEHVLVALDLSPAADALLGCLGGLRELGAKRLTLVHVAEVDYPVFGAIGNLDRHRDRLEDQARSLVGDGFEVEVVATAGNAAAEILKVAAERGATMVLIGSRSHSRVREAFIGSVAADVVRRARVPVLLQRVAPRADQDGPAFTLSCWDPDSHILLPTDFSVTAERAFRVVEAIARAGAGSFTLMHVHDPAADDAVVQAGRDNLEALAERLRAAATRPVAVEARVGDPAGEILALAAQDPSTIIVLGTQGRGLVAEAVLGSVSRVVVRQARGSVLLVPANR
jgi:nucleotide-binding universal stress UspA family protein